MQKDQIEALARELLSAKENGSMINVRPSERDGFNLDAAYAVEGALKAFREAEGCRAIGQKVGYANRAMWRALKLETLVWAHMYDDTALQQRQHGHVISSASAIAQN
jgi:2-keto-4-pentenoate hydratase